MYKMTSCVRYSECGPDNKLTPGALINYFQDCTTGNSERMGVGNSFLRARNRAWILTSWQIEIYRYPQCGEDIEVHTWATGFKGMFGPRDFLMQTPEGEKLACAHSLWVYMDTQAQEIVKIEDDDISMYEIGEPILMEKVSRKIKVPEEVQMVDTFKVHKYHIDTNNHMNNCHYVQMAREALPQGFQVKKMRVEYKNSAMYGDTILLKRGIEDNRVVAQLCREDNTVYAVVEFIGED